MKVTQSRKYSKYISHVETKLLSRENLNWFSYNLYFYLSSEKKDERLVLFQSVLGPITHFCFNMSLTGSDKNVKILIIWIMRCLRVHILNTAPKGTSFYNLNFLHPLIYSEILIDFWVNWFLLCLVYLNISMCVLCC